MTVKEALSALHTYYVGSDMEHDAYIYLRDAIKSIKEANPVGKWIRRQSWSEGFGMGESYGFYWECSICGRQTKGDYDECGRNFCHNCGADMRERDKE